MTSIKTITKVEDESIDKSYMYVQLVSYFLTSHDSNLYLQYYEDLYSYYIISEETQNPQMSERPYT